MVFILPALANGSARSDCRKYRIVISKKKTAQQSGLWINLIVLTIADIF